MGTGLKTTTIIAHIHMSLFLFGFRQDQSFSTKYQSKKSVKS